MSISLVKGQKISLTKNDGTSLSKVSVGLGWDPVNQGSGFLGKLFHSKQDIDCDASVFLLENDHLMQSDDVVYFGHLNHASKAVHHCGDNLTGDGDGDDEQIIVDLKKLPEQYNRLVFVVNIYQAGSRQQNFGMLDNAFIRIVDLTTNQEFCRFNLSDRSLYDGKTAMIFGEIYRHQGQGDWKFSANGEGTMDDSIHQLSERYL